ncbi:predicted protein [Neofusicoccum parvum]|uniref:Uncharacterized protein n=1 Tax=Neofusicoccum parvum TaxID=310453 RepID=A0ACB5S982_9PEZI|nr:predicted protein [Neofusicoccum parvum]
MNAIRETLEATKVSTESFRTAEADAHPEARMRDKAVTPPSKLHSAFVEIAALGQETVDRLLAGFEVEYLPLYPFVSLRKARYQARTLFLGSEEATRTRIVDLDILKAILAIQMQFDDGLDCPIKDHLLSHIGWDVGRCAMGDVVGTEDIEICALISLYLFHRDESTKALRMIQFASRLCFDLGLNRAETYRSRAVGAENAQSLGMLFCCVCVLEHRLGFALQTPYLTRYTEIDDEVLDLPLIKAMLVFDRLSAQMYDHVQGRQQTLREADERNYLEYRIQSLEESLPPQLRYHEGLMAPELTLSERVALNLQGMLYIRRNHLKVVLYTRHQTASALGGPPAKSSDQVVEPAKNTIRFCTSLVKTGSMLPALRTSFEYFLASALAAMFLVVARRPDSYGEACRDHFHEAIKVLEGSPARFHAPQENWCTLDDLKRIAKRLSMPMPEPEATAPERGADYSADRGLSQATIDELLCWTYGDSSQLGLDDFIFLTEGD